MTRRTRSRRRGGFTLVEVLLVLVILVVLASMAVMAYGPMQQRARVDAALSQIGLFKTPLELYQTHVGDYPATAQGLEALVTPPADMEAGGWSGPYLKPAVPLDPWSRPYQYEYPGRYNVNDPDIWSMGPDGINGNEDDIGNWQT